MGKLGRATSWKEHRLADRFELDGRAYTVDLVARRATGVQGYRVTVVFLPHEEGREVEVALPNAATNADVNRMVRERAGDEAALRALFGEATSS